MSSLVVPVLGGGQQATDVATAEAIAMYDSAGGLNPNKLTTPSLVVSGVATYQVMTVTTTYTITNTDATIFLCDATSAAFTITLPSPSTNNGRRIFLKKKDGSANAVTVATPTGTIDGASTHSLPSQYNSCWVTSDGTNWWIS